MKTLIGLIAIVAMTIGGARAQGTGTPPTPDNGSCDAKVSRCIGQCVQHNPYNVCVSFCKAGFLCAHGGSAPDHLAAIRSRRPVR